MRRKTTVSDETVDALAQGGARPDARACALEIGPRELDHDKPGAHHGVAQRQTRDTQISDVPADLVEIGQRTVAAIHAAVQHQAATKIEPIETDSLNVSWGLSRWAERLTFE